jgi:hypothetical protein
MKEWGSWWRLKMMDLKSLAEALKGGLGGRSDAVAAHYGVSDEKMSLWVRQMLSDFVLSELKSDVVDKWFPALGAEDKAKVFAFCRALVTHQRME